MKKNIYIIQLKEKNSHWQCYTHLKFDTSLKMAKKSIKILKEEGYANCEFRILKVIK